MTVVTFSVLVAIISGIVVFAGIVEWIIWSRICKRLEVIETKLDTLTVPRPAAVHSALPTHGINLLDEVKELREEQKAIPEET